jgi:hypothetical protein
VIISTALSAQGRRQRRNFIGWDRLVKFTWEKTMGDLMEESSPLALTRQARAVPSCGIKQIFSSFFVGSKAQKNLQRLSAGCEWENCF